MADCIRTIENISDYDFTYRLDHPTFDKAAFKEALPMVSPKLVTLMENIKELDKQGQYKHMIFSDLKSEGGAKTIAAAFLAYGYNLVYDKTLAIQEKAMGKKSFAMLCSTKLYGKDVGVRFRRDVLGRFNARPDNVYGENIRFIILDYGFKEGIDLFDIKYIHILETPVTVADKKQIIGRGTRFCGQKGLIFDEGWPLHVFIYKSVLPERLSAVHGHRSLYDLFLEKSNIDLTKERFAKELEKRCIQASVDFSLNKTIHGHSQEFKALEAEVNKTYAPFFKLPEEKNKPAKINCLAGCKGPMTEYPTDLLLLVWYSLPNTFLIQDKWPRPTLCKYLVENKAYCKKVNEVFGDYAGYILSHKTELVQKVERLSGMMKSQKAGLLNFIESVSVERDPETPNRFMTYYDMQAFMMVYYKKLAWPPIKMENLCIEKAKKPSISVKTVDFTPTQKTLQQYFQPSNPYKGMLLWHSTGVGKTCTGISVATNSFEKEGYSILWVTRNTLIGDIWKNMFIQVCSKTLGSVVPEEAMKNPLKYVSDRWIQPLTYKQFSNLLQGKNQFYQDMVNRNGSADPLKKTLIIIDEAHKLLSGDLKPQERPDFEVLKKYIHDSYATSKKDSVRLLLMTATPYTTNPFSLIKLLNLLREPNEQLVEDQDIFNTHYLNSQQAFKYPLEFLNQVSGYISYLNREADIRQFAYPVVKTIEVPISESHKSKYQNRLAVAESEYDLANKNVIANLEEKKKAKDKIKAEKTLLMRLCKGSKSDCKREVELKAKQFEKDLFQEADRIIEESKEKMKTLGAEIKYLNKKIKTPDASQESMLDIKCLKS